mgnify:CR=1 FL=1
MDLPKTFLVVDDNADSRFLLVKTLLRKFPTAIIRECQECVDAVKIAQLDTLAAIVAHRAADLDGISLIRELRAANPKVIILMVSGLDRTESAIRAGATCFLNYDEWLRVGSLVTDLLSRSAQAQAGRAGGGRGNLPPECNRPGIGQSKSTPTANN